ncbi:MAG: viroplasmin family protein, partial [Clostridia bacterium]
MNALRYYAVANGRCTGIYTDPQEYLQQIHQYKNACAKSFSCLEDAERFMAAHRRFPSSFSQLKKALSLGEGPYCYVDFEYTCRNEKPKECKNHGVELLSVGAVIRNASDQTVGQYYSLIRPLNNRILSEYCKELTGLCQEEIDAARNSIPVLKEFFAYCQSLG